jgi:hypothetical protein
MRGNDRLNIGFFPHRLVMVEPSSGHCAGLREALKPNFLTESSDLLRQIFTIARLIRIQTRRRHISARNPASMMASCWISEKIGRPARDPVEK